MNIGIYLYHFIHKFSYSISVGCYFYSTTSFTSSLCYYLMSTSCSFYSFFTSLVSYFSWFSDSLTSETTYSTWTTSRIFSSLSSPFSLSFFASSHLISDFPLDYSLTTDNLFSSTDPRFDCTSFSISTGEGISFSSNPLTAALIPNTICSILDPIYLFPLIE